VKWKQDEFAKARKLTVAPSANEIKILYSYDVSIRAIVDAVKKMHTSILLCI